MSIEEYHKKTILQVVPALVSGGVERGTLEIAKKVVESGYKSIVISAGGPLVKILQASGSKHIKLNVASKNPITIWLNSQKIAKIIVLYIRILDKELHLTELLINHQKI